MCSPKISVNNTQKAKVTDTFGLYSDAAVLARQQMLFAPRLRELNPFPVRAPECPTERATYILRQMSPDLDTIYNRYPIIPADKYSFNRDLDKWERSEKKGKYFSKHDSVITAQTSAQIEALQDYPIDKPVIIEGPVSAYIDGIETPVYIMRGETNRELTEREKRNEKFDPGWSRLISNKEWFADFYGKDLETGQVIAGKRNTTYYGKDGVTSYLNDERTLIEKAHETLLMYPVEEEQFEKVDWKVIMISA